MSTLLSSLRTISFHLHERRNIFVTSRKKRRSASRIEDDYSRWTRISKCALLIREILLSLAERVTAAIVVDRRLLSNAVLGSARLGLPFTRCEFTRNKTEPYFQYRLHLRNGSGAGMPFANIHVSIRHTVHTCTCEHTSGWCRYHVRCTLYSVSAAMHAGHVW